MAKPRQLVDGSAEQGDTTLRQPWLNMARVLWIVLSAAALVALIAGAVRICAAPGLHNTRRCLRPLVG
jgi:hypothetical protein